MDSKLWILLNPASDQVHKHSETALDTQQDSGNLQNFCGATVVQKRKMQVSENQALALLVPGAGIEPARIAPLVFETSASTDSAIRAGCIWEAGPRGDAEGDRPSG